MCALESHPNISPLPEGDAYFTVKLQDYTAVEKDQVVLDCELSKDVDVMWYHNEAEIKPSKVVAIKSEGKRRALVIKTAGDKDKGQYVCDCGTDKTMATLHIEGKNKVLHLLRLLTTPQAPSHHLLTPTIITCMWCLSSLRHAEHGGRTLQESKVSNLGISVVSCSVLPPSLVSFVLVLFVSLCALEDLQRVFMIPSLKKQTPLLFFSAF